LANLNARKTNFATINEDDNFDQPTEIREENSDKEFNDCLISSDSKIH
jgi:hypothetical protein